MSQERRGRPKMTVPVEEVRDLIEARFSVTEIAKIVGASRSTIHKRMQDINLKVRGTYSSITDEELHEVMASIIVENPNIGMKLMKGMLFSRGIRIQELRLRAAMREVDPIGVENRRHANRAIVRRTYSVPCSNALWHLDTNMKLTRYKIIIKGCIDGKSRFCVYIDAADNNTALSHLHSFMNGARKYGLPERTRSDKGGENVLIARLMITARGPGMGSHLTGRSVHNQRIERFWGDVNKLSITYYEAFRQLEEDGILNIDDENHMFILHYVYLPRLQIALEEFRNGWNHHSLSTEHNKSPQQLQVLYADPVKPQQMDTGSLELIYSQCRSLHEEVNEEPDIEDPVRHPSRINHTISDHQLLALARIDTGRPSEFKGKDIFEQCIRVLAQDQGQAPFARD